MTKRGHDPDEYDDGDDADDADDGDEGDEGEFDDGDEDDDEVEDALGGARSNDSPAAAVSPVASEPSFGPPAPPTVQDVARAASSPATRDGAGRFVGIRARKPFHELTDARVIKLDLRKYEWNPSLGRNAERYVRGIAPPFPALSWPSFLTWARDSYGPGKYRVVQYGAEGYIGARTFDLTDGVPLESPVAPATNGNGHGAAIPPAIAQYAGMDFKTALVVVGIPALTGALTQFAAAMAHRPADNSLDRVLEVVKLAQISNKERADLFKEALELAASVERPAAGESQSPQLGDLSALATAAAEILKAMRPAPAPQPVAPQPAPAQAAVTAGSAPAQDSAKFLEQMIVQEIRRAVTAGDEPECLTIILETWLDEAALSWLTESDEETVLQELPLRFVAHGEYLKTEPVQNFLRRTLAMLREDAENSDVEESHASAPEPATA